MPVAFDANVMLGAMRAIVADGAKELASPDDSACLSTISSHAEDSMVPAVAIFEVTRRMTPQEQVAVTRIMSGLRIVPFDDEAARVASINHSLIREAKAYCRKCLEVEGEVACRSCGSKHSPDRRRNDWMVVCTAIQQNATILFTLDVGMQGLSGKLLTADGKTSSMAIQAPRFVPVQLAIPGRDFR